MRSYMSLGIHEADLAVDAITADLTRTGRAAVIAVADVHGELVTLVRLDGAPPASILIAANKAWTAARERRPTRDLGSPRVIPNRASTWRTTAIRATSAGAAASRSWSTARWSGPSP